MTETTELELQAPDSERALIGCAGFYPEAIAHILERLPGGDFFDLVRGTVWDTCRKLSADREPLTPMTVAKRMVADGAWSERAQRIVQVEMSTASPVGHADRHGDLVSELARRRELLRAVNRARALVVEFPDVTEVLPRIRAEFEELVAPERATSQGPMGWDALLAEFEIAQGPDGDRPAISTPWSDLDSLLGGLFGGRVYVFGGRPGMGKSSAALNLAMHAASKQQRQALVISKEMPSVDVTGRIIAAGAEVPLGEINARQLSDMSRQKVKRFLDRVGRVPITVDTRSRSLSGIKTLARVHHHRHGLDLLVVDYLQLVRTDTPGRSREQEVAEVSRELKALALELGIVVALPAQLNRGSVQRADQRPTMADLRDSGQIEQDADAVILLHRPTEEARNGEIDLIVDKNRHGPTAVVTCAWRGGYGTIAGLAREDTA